MSFKPGQKVVVLKWHASGGNGAGVYLGPSKNLWEPGKFRIEIDGMVVLIEPERLVDEAQFWEEEHKKNGK